MSNRRALHLWACVVVVSQVISGLRAKKNYHTLPEIVPISQNVLERQEEGISLIIPARNEEANLPRLLASIVRLEYSSFEVIVVDDASTDDTAAVVRGYARTGVRLVQVAGPPSGWTGKNNACWVGAGKAVYPWLLFVDADTELEPSALRSTIHFAQEQHVRALSLFPRQRCETFWERLLLPVAYQQYFVGMNARKVNGPVGPALANGQYFFIRQDAYQQSGGHAANAESIIDDVALATNLKHHGVVPLACRGEELVSVRMYTTLRQIIKGFGKNSYQYIQQSPLTGIQIAISTTLAASIVMLFFDAHREKSRVLFGIAIAAYSIQVWNMLPWLKKFNIALHHAVLAPFASLAFLLIAINSLLHSITGRSISWKGRSYATRPRLRVLVSKPVVLAGFHMPSLMSVLCVRGCSKFCATIMFSPFRWKA